MNSRTSSIVLGIIVLILILIIGFLLVRGSGTSSQTATSTSATTTNAVASSSTNTAPAGIATTTTTTTTHTTQTTYHNATSAEIKVTQPASGATVSHSLNVSGQAVGPWYSEAVFPVMVMDKNGATIATGQAHAQGDWMTTSLVPFTTTISIPQSYTGAATLMLMKDNPSGLPANAASVSIPITVQ